MGGKIRKGIVCLAAFAAALSGASAQEKTERSDSLVRLMRGKSVELVEIDGQQYRKAIESTFLHNGTYLTSDTALWNVEGKIINAWGHVQVIQDETVLTSEYLDYLVDENLASFRGTLVQLENKRQNVLRTKNLDYNTKDSVAFFFKGAAMRDKDGQLIESRDGTYDSKIEEFLFSNQVNMFTDSVFVRTESLKYQSAANRAIFLDPIDFWKGDYMLSARGGWYDRGAELFFFQGDVHSLSDKQEAWSDSLYYNRKINDVLMLGNAQVQDTTRNVYAMAHRIHYADSISRLMLQRDATVVLRTEESGGKVDTLYCGADTLIYQSIYKFNVPGNVFKEVEERLGDLTVDPVAEYRRKSAEAAAAAAQQAKESAMEGMAKTAGGTKQKSGEGEEGPPPPPDSDATAEDGKPAESGNLPPASQTIDPPPDHTDSLAALPDSLAALPDSLAVPSDSLAALPDSLAVPSDSLAALPDSLAALPDSLAVPSDSLSALPDSLAVPSDSLAALPDSLAVPSDSLAALPDSLAAPLDSTKIGFAWGIGNVRIFRSDMQVRCDSVAFCDLDSLARFYKNPIVWNDGNRQYTSDSLFVLVKGGRMDRASLMSNAFIITQEDSLCFDQIKGSEVMAYFDTTSALRRFDALGGANALFYLKENDALATVNKVECKIMSATLRNGEVERVYYFEQPHNDACPIVQMQEGDKKIKGFNWDPDRRPSSPEDISPLKLRPSERKHYLKHPRTRFTQAAIYFPGYIDGIHREIFVRDSLSRLPRRTTDSLTVADSLSAVKDSLLPLRDSLSVTADSLSTNTDTSSVQDAVVESAASSESAAVAPVVMTAAQIRAQKAAQRIAKREARWAELDARDAARAKVKEQKALEKKRAKTRRAIERQRRQDAKDEAKLQRYIEFYKKQKSRDDARKQKSEPAGELPSGIEAGRELSPDVGPGPKTDGGDSLFSGNGLADDNPVLGSGRLSGSEGRSGL